VSHRVSGRVSGGGQTLEIRGLRMHQNLEPEEGEKAGGKGARGWGSKTSWADLHEQRA
jgi:hypothetical protein